MKNKITYTPIFVGLTASGYDVNGVKEELALEIIKAQHIVEKIASYYQLTFEEVVKSGRKGAIGVARRAAIYRIIYETKLSKVAIGSLFIGESKKEKVPARVSGMSHATVSDIQKKINLAKKLLVRQERLRPKLLAILQLIKQTGTEDSNGGMPEVIDLESTPQHTGNKKITKELMVPFLSNHIKEPQGIEVLKNIGGIEVLQAIQEVSALTEKELLEIGEGNPHREYHQILIACIKSRFRHFPLEKYAEMFTIVSKEVAHYTVEDITEFLVNHEQKMTFGKLPMLEYATHEPYRKLVQKIEATVLRNMKF